MLTKHSKSQVGFFPSEGPPHTAGLFLTYIHSECQTLKGFTQFVKKSKILSNIRRVSHENLTFIDDIPMGVCYYKAVLHNDGKFWEYSVFMHSNLTFQ